MNEPERLDLDPNATLLDLLAALEHGDVIAFAEAADDLAGWLGRGGFPPDSWPDSDRGRSEWYVVLTEISETYHRYLEEH